MNAWKRERIIEEGIGHYLLKEERRVGTIIELFASMIFTKARN
jgi:hypothetical protein